MIFNFLRLMVRAVIKLLYRIRVEGRGNFPKKGAIVLCANHTYYKDLLIIGSISPRKIHWMAKSELFRNPLFGALIKSLGAFSVNRGGNDRDSVKTVYNVLNSGAALGIFPEGTRVNDPDNRPPYKRSFVTFAAKTGAAILPVAVSYGGGPFGRGRLFSRAVLSFGEAVRLEQGHKYSRDELDGHAASIMSWIYGRIATNH